MKNTNGNPNKFCLKTNKFCLKLIKGIQNAIYSVSVYNIFSVH